MSIYFLYIIITFLLHVLDGEWAVDMSMTGPTGHPSVPATITDTAPPLRPIFEVWSYPTTFTENVF